MITVSLIEDDARLRKLVAGWIGREKDMRVEGQYPDAEAALADMPASCPDVALVDINLPGQSGIDCVLQLKPKLPKTQFVMLTMYEDSDRIFQALAAGATGYLLKRSAGDELIGAIREVQAGGSPMSGHIARKVVQIFHGAPMGQAPDRLSEQENKVLELLANGLYYKEIVDSLGVSMGTVNTYIRRIYEKLHVHTREQAVLRFRQQAGKA